jgi:integrase
VAQCPQCGSQKTWKDGVRKTNYGDVQRYLCRDCGFRFSENGFAKDFCTASSLGSSCRIGAVPKAHGQVINLAAIEPLKEGPAGATTTNQADLKGKLVEYLWYMKKQGYAETTVQTYASILKLLIKRGADIFDPESVKKVIAQQTSWGSGRKWNVVKAYTLFLKMQGLTWEKPKYKPIETLQFIPTEKEIDALIAGSSKQMALFLQILKETGARRGEAYNLKWKDVDLTQGTIRITPEKGSNPRQFKISKKLAAMLASTQQQSGRVWKYANIVNLEKTFRRQRKRNAHKLQNPRLLRIHFHTLRHWKATTEYAKTKDILYVQKLLGHRSLKTTLRYIQHIVLPQNEEYICKAAKTVEEATDLIEAGFQYVTDIGDTKLFRKLKTSYLGT